MPNTLHSIKVLKNFKGLVNRHFMKLEYKIRIIHYFMEIKYKIRIIRYFMEIKYKIWIIHYLFHPLNLNTYWKFYLYL